MCRVACSCTLSLWCRHCRLPACLRCLLLLLPLRLLRPRLLLLLLLLLLEPRLQWLLLLPPLALAFLTSLASLAPDSLEQLSALSLHLAVD